ncbi:MAG TPA: CHAT domain-containing tetratricopeptide repeat protein, partial [Thermoanaerobaculia bacterium]|nr:CHAT domain-containing tetratricopeptide repeat protein [Thermoanaerobaculia bacterium]
GKLEEAERLLSRSLAIRSFASPGSVWEAESLHALGRLTRDAGRTADALGFFRRALDALDAQRAGLGSSDQVRSRLSSSYRDLYDEAIELFVTAGKSDEALEALERSRARSFLDLLARRDLTFASDVPEALRKERQRLQKEEQDLEEERSELDPKDAAAVEAAAVKATRLREESGRLSRRIARGSPRYAALTEPKTLDAEGMRRLLPSGTLWLSYHVTPGGARVFAVTRDAIAVATLPLSGKDLAREVEVFRSLILRGAEESGDDDALAKQARRLTDALLSPVAEPLARAERILVSPDGALRALPFAALSSPDGRARYAVERWPITYAVSATVYGELVARSRRGTAGGRTVAFGGPAYEASPKARPGSGALALYRAGLPPLPNAAEEAESIADLFRPNGVAYVGQEATEERVKAIGRNVRFVHLACHAVQDPRFPIDSGLALAAPREKSRENGLLQVWEVFESVRLDADLVTLSACGSGLGADAGSEGLFGMVRAFQYAGARSVAGALWNVPDRSIGRLMRRFYRGLAAGAPRDEALRAAQLDLLSHDATRAPYYWASLALFGSR